jgi:protein SERAC1
VRAAQANEEDEPIVSALYRATYGILFFAVPHKGMMTEDMLSMLGQDDHPRAVLLTQINRSSEYLISQLADFKDLIGDRKIVTFYETQQTRKLQQVRFWWPFERSNLPDFDSLL